MLGNFLINSPTAFNHFLLHFLHLKRRLLFLCPIKSDCDLIFYPFMHALHSSSLISSKLSTRFDSEVGINLKLSINFSLCVVVLPLPCSENRYRKSNILSIFFLVHSDSPLNSSANCWTIK